MLAYLCVGARGASVGRKFWPKTQHATRKTNFLYAFCIPKECSRFRPPPDLYGICTFCVCSLRKNTTQRDAGNPNLIYSLDNSFRTIWPRPATARPQIANNHRTRFSANRNSTNQGQEIVRLLCIAYIYIYLVLSLFMIYFKIAFWLFAVLCPVSSRVYYLRTAGVCLIDDNENGWTNQQPTIKCDFEIPHRKHTHTHNLVSYSFD